MSSCSLWLVLNMGLLLSERFGDKGIIKRYINSLTCLVYFFWLYFYRLCSLRTMRFTFY